MKALWIIIIIIDERIIAFRSIKRNLIALFPHSKYFICHLTLIFRWQRLPQMITAFRSYELRRKSYIQVHGKCLRDMNRCQYHCYQIFNGFSFRKWIKHFSFHKFTMSIYHKNSVCQLNYYFHLDVDTCNTIAFSETVHGIRFVLG